MSDSWDIRPLIDLMYAGGWEPTAYSGISVGETQEWHVTWERRLLSIPMPGEPRDPEIEHKDAAREPEDERA